jgi:hypothetical protein
MATGTRERSDALWLLLSATQFEYPLRWVDEQTSKGDFDGREVSIDVFTIIPQRQREFLRVIREVRPRLQELIGSRCIFIFHSPEATKAHYSHLVCGGVGSESFLFEDLDPTGKQVPNHAAFHEVV